MSNSLLHSVELDNLIIKARQKIEAQFTLYLDEKPQAPGFTQIINPTTGEIEDSSISSSEASDLKAKLDTIADCLISLTEIQKYSRQEIK